MRHLLLICAILPLLTEGTTRQEKQSDLPGLKPLLFIIERVLDNQASAQKQSQRLLQPTPQQQDQNAKQQQQKPAEAAGDLQQQQQERVEKNSLKPTFERQQNLVNYAGLPFYDPQFQYPGYNFGQPKQPGGRVQPQIYIYETSGQGQPILINPGNPPGNFLVPHQPQPQPGPNFVFRNNPSQRPVAGYPKPAHIPPIDKDAEEIPTDPARIPPLPSSRPAVSAKKPEKLETFNEGKTEYPTKLAGETDVLESADRNPQLKPGGPLKPGQRFFILNGEPLFPDNFQYEQYPDLARLGLKYPPEYQLNQQFHPEQQVFQPDGFQKQQQLQYDLIQRQSEPVLFQKQQQIYPAVIQQQQLKQENLQSIQQSQPQQKLQLDALPRAQYQTDIFQRQFQPESLARQGIFNAPLYPYFRNTATENSAGQNADINQQSLFNPSVPFNIGQDDLFPIGQFKFNAPSDPYFPAGGEDLENDAIVVDAKIEGSPDMTVESANVGNLAKSSEPSTAQASPGAVAIAGPGGVAGAGPRATALVGKGGLAVASPQATAISGTREDEKKQKRKNKIK